MKLLIELITKFGHFIIVINLIILTLLIFLKHFGFADLFGNFFITTSVLILLVKMFRIRTYKPAPGKKVFPEKLLILGWVSIVITGVFVFRSIFSPGPAAWGDAPYFYPESFKDFLSEPLVWESRGRLGVVNDLYWIYPLMLIYYWLGALVGLSNDIIIRLVFYFPAIFTAFLSPWMFTRYLGFSPVVQVFSVLIYSLSTYFILLIDGGQVGVALAYGLFPLALLHLYKLIAIGTISQFFATLCSFMLLIIADVRFAAIALLVFVIWVFFVNLLTSRSIELKQLNTFVIFGITTFILSLYFLIPALIIEPTTGSGTRSDLQLITVLNPLMLFSPHWPLNEFGKIFPPNWFFAGIPILIFINLFFKKTWKIFFLIFNYLLFVFLVKGDTGFLGNIYAWIVDTFPFGGAFRDSTKFFAPLLLSAGILIGVCVENLSQLFKKQIVSKLVFFFVFIYLLFLIAPAINGKMHGVLAGREFSPDLQVIAGKISSENDFLRTVWFPEHHPLGFSTERKPALDAKMLVSLRPFASLNVGNSDLFNFLHNKQTLQWLDIFGIRYLIFSGDSRRVLPDREKENDWENLLNLVENVNYLNRVSWDTSLPVYQTKSSKPRFFAVDKVFAVIGGDDIYQTLIDADRKFSIGKQGFIFFEDGKFDPGSLHKVTQDSLVLVFNQKEKKDLNFSFLSEYFQGPMVAKKSGWAKRSTGEYLKWKFELLVNGVATNEFDYGKGIAYSSKPNEELIFDLSAPEYGEYVLAVRHMSASESGSLQLSLEDYEEEIPLSAPGLFDWYTKPLKLNAGRYDLILENRSGFQVVNVVALIPKKDWESADRLTQDLISKFPTDSNVGVLTTLSNWHEVSYAMVSPVEYYVEVPPKMPWLVFTDSYHPKWNLKSGSINLSVYPFYSAVNGFYVGQNGLLDGKLFFKEQEKLRVAAGLSLVFLIILLGILVGIYYTNYRRKRSV